MAAHLYLLLLLLRAERRATLNIRRARVPESLDSLQRGQRRRRGIDEEKRGRVKAFPHFFPSLPHPLS